VRFPEVNNPEQVARMKVPSQEQIDAASLTGHAVVAGYGLPGRAVGDLLRSRKIPFCVIELNAGTVRRCELVVPIIEGDVIEEDTLRRAGIERSWLLALTVPSDGAVLQAIAIARRLNPKIHIVARCRFISSGMQAHRAGANEVIVEEQAVASEFVKVIQARPGLATAEDRGGVPGCQGG
jgi:CPA2 family monovalent cation:H+ antiporter-2